MSAKQSPYIRRRRIESSIRLYQKRIDAGVREIERLQRVMNRRLYKYHDLKRKSEIENSQRKARTKVNYYKIMMKNLMDKYGIN
jgi:hypothetical protein